MITLIFLTECVCVCVYERLCVSVTVCVFKIKHLDEGCQTYFSSGATWRKIYSHVGLDQ